jgi:hypothetical protein
MLFTHRNPEMQLDKEHTALVVADLQNEFLRPDTGTYYELIEDSLREHDVASHLEQLLQTAQDDGYFVIHSPHWYSPTDLQTAPAVLASLSKGACVAATRGLAMDRPGPVGERNPGSRPCGWAVPARVRRRGGSGPNGISHVPLAPVAVRTGSKVRPPVQAARQQKETTA